MSNGSGLAIFGGTFDPIHNAHLRIAREAADRCGLRQILFIPAAKPPHRSEGPLASYEDRFQMVSIACGEDPRFSASRLEEGTEKSYSIRTIEVVKAAVPGEELFFIIGADAFADFRSWYRWQEIVGLVTFIVVSRPGAEYQIPAGARVVALEGIALPVSSSEIRQGLASGECDLPLPEGVARYIRLHGLYSTPR